MLPSRGNVSNLAGHVTEPVKNYDLMNGRERLQNICSLMETTGWSAEQVMIAMKIPPTEQPKYLKLLPLPQ